MAVDALLGCPWPSRCIIFVQRETFSFYIFRGIRLSLYDFWTEAHLRTFSYIRRHSSLISSSRSVFCFPHLAY